MSNIVTFYPVFPIPKENLTVHFAKSSEDKGEVPPQFIAVQKQPARPLSTPPVSSTLSPPGLHAIGNLHSHSNRVWAVPGTLQLLSKMSSACVLLIASHPSSSTQFQWMPFCQYPPFLVVVVTHVTRTFLLGIYASMLSWLRLRVSNFSNSSDGLNDISISWN